MKIYVKLFCFMVLTHSYFSYLTISFIFEVSSLEVGNSSFGHVTEWKIKHNSEPQKVQQHLKKYFMIRHFKNKSLRTCIYRFHSFLALFAKKFNLDKNKDFFLELHIIEL